MKKVDVKIIKKICLGQEILDISKTLMYEFWYDYIKPKYEDKARLCYMDTDSFVINNKIEDFYKEIASGDEKWFDTSNYDNDNDNDKRPLPVGINKKVIGKFKDELGVKIMTEFCALSAKAYAYKIDDDTEHKRAKGKIKCVIKIELMFESYRYSLFNDKIILRSQQRLRSDHHRVYAEEVNTISVSSKDDKGIQTFDKITTYPCGINLFKICEHEMIYKFDDRLNNEEQEPRNKSLIIRNESQALEIILK